MYLIHLSASSVVLVEHPYTLEMSDAPIVKNTVRNPRKRTATDDDLYAIPAVVTAAGKPRKKHARPPTFEEGFGSLKPRTSGGKYYPGGEVAMD